MAIKYTKQPLTARSISTLTPLLDWFTCEHGHRMFVVLINDDGSNNANLIVETSEDPSVSKKVDAMVFNSPCLPSAQTSIEIDNPSARKYYRVSAQTDSPGFPTVNIRWQVTWIQEFSR
jgi:hypothetical protein